MIPNHRLHASILLFMLWIVLPLSCIPTAKAAQNKEIPKFNVRVDVVSVDIEVLNNVGNPVPGLSEEDFLIRENGKKVKIVNFAQRYNHPVSLAILLDISTIELKKLNIEKQFILNIIHLLDHKDDICLYSFDSRGACLEADFTSDRKPLVEALENIAVSSKRKWGFLAEFFGAGPATGLGIDRAIHNHRNSGHSKKIILIISNRFRGLGPATVEHVQSSQCTLYTLGFDNKSAVIASIGGDQISKRQLLRESGGRNFAAETEDVMRVSKTIVRSMKNYYSIGYETDADVVERRIEVRIPGRDYTIHARRTMKRE